MERDRGGKLGRDRKRRLTHLNRTQPYEGRNIEKTAPFEVREISFQLFAGSTVDQYKSQNAIRRQGTRARHRLHDKVKSEDAGYTPPPPQSSICKQVIKPPPLENEPRAVEGLYAVHR